jgi:cobalt-zinc-cadmium efflux system outer membrane protein
MDILAAKARVARSAAFPNPELGIETSSLGDEDSVVVSQPFEFSRKRDARVKAAEAEIPLYKNNRQITRLDIIDQVSLAFVSMLGGQEKLVLVKEAHDIAERFAGTVAERVAAGDISPIEEIRANVSLGGAATDLARARRELSDARLALAAAMGDAEAGFTTVEGRIPAEPIVPDKNTLISAITTSPDLAQWELDRERRNAMVMSEKASRIPDITFSGKVSHYREIEETAFIFGISVPLPFFDRNRGGILEVQCSIRGVAGEIGDRKAVCGIAGARL